MGHQKWPPGSVIIENLHKYKLPGKQVGLLARRRFTGTAVTGYRTGLINGLGESDFSLGTPSHLYSLYSGF